MPSTAPVRYNRGVKHIPTFAGALLVALPRTRCLGLLLLGPVVTNIVAFHVLVVGVLRAALAGSVPFAAPVAAQDAPPRDDGLVVAAPAKSPAAAHTPYLVVAVDLPPADAADAADAGFRTAADAAAAFHRAPVLEWNGADLDRLTTLLAGHTPRHVLFVLRPATLDLVLHRRILLASACVDGDPFPDFAFGYLTAESGAGCERTWQRIRALHERGAIAGSWVQASVCTADASFDVPADAKAFPVAAGFDSRQYYFATGDPGRERVLAKALGALATAAVAEFSGCGDPQGIWLFSDQRNMASEKHWDYAPERVGDDPHGEMPRLLARRFRDLTLPSTIVWSGTCHSGAVDRVFVEGDIVSTFGRTARTTVHHLGPEDSLALAWLHAGAAALLVPIGANHGMSVMREIDFALSNGACLGDAIKSTWDDVFFAADGPLQLDLPVAGEPHRHGEDVMRGGGANRVLIGDPALRPFRAMANPIETVTVDRGADGTLLVHVVRREGFAPRAWDMFGGRTGEDWRVAARVRIDDDAARWRVSVSPGAAAPGGRVGPFRLRRAAIEDFDGLRYLHVQANAPRADIENRAAEVTFELRPRR